MQTRRNTPNSRATASRGASNDVGGELPPAQFKGLSVALTRFPAKLKANQPEETTHHARNHRGAADPMPSTQRRGLAVPAGRPRKRGVPQVPPTGVTIGHAAPRKCGNFPLNDDQARYVETLSPANAGKLPVAVHVRQGQSTTPSRASRPLAAVPTTSEKMSIESVRRPLRGSSEDS